MKSAQSQGWIMADGPAFDPHEVLGLSQGCSPEELRDAYRKKSKKHHPDGGGDEWAFRVVVWAHESLTQRLERDRMVAMARETPDVGRIRQGIQDKGVDPTRLVHIEVIWLRYEVDDVMGLLAEKKSGESRNLSGSLAITWPGEDVNIPPSQIPNVAKILNALNAAFDDLRARTSTTLFQSRIEDNRFSANLGYATGKLAYEAFKHLHNNLRARGLGVKQWTRDVTLPRETT
jgi:hypothetical protein